jgi:hypothetical protein
MLYSTVFYSIDIGGETNFSSSSRPISMQTSNGLLDIPVNKPFHKAHVH